MPGLLGRNQCTTFYAFTAELPKSPKAMVESLVFSNVFSEEWRKREGVPPPSSCPWFWKGLLIGRRIVMVEMFWEMGDNKNVPTWILQGAV